MERIKRITVVQEVGNDYKSLEYKSCTLYIYTGEKLGSSKQGASQTGKPLQKKKTKTLSTCIIQLQMGTQHKIQKPESDRKDNRKYTTYKKRKGLFGMTIRLHET